MPIINFLYKEEYNLKIFIVAASVIKTTDKRIKNLKIWVKAKDELEAKKIAKEKLISSEHTGLIFIKQIVKKEFKHE